MRAKGYHWMISILPYSGSSDETKSSGSSSHRGCFSTPHSLAHVTVPEKIPSAPPKKSLAKRFGKASPSLLHNPSFKKTQLLHLNASNFKPLPAFMD
jgi:hypothetical protein